jgi:hypothetical protein
MRRHQKTAANLDDEDDDIGGDAERMEPICPTGSFR